jgi:hypothetical protein
MCPVLLVKLVSLVVNRLPRPVRTTHNSTTFPDPSSRDTLDKPNQDKLIQDRPVQDKKSQDRPVQDMESQDSPVQDKKIQDNLTGRKRLLS